MERRNSYLTVYQASGYNLKTITKDIDRCIELCQDDDASWVDDVKFVVEPETEEVKGQFYALILCRSPREAE